MNSGRVGDMRKALSVVSHVFLRLIRTAPACAVRSLTVAAQFGFRSLTVAARFANLGMNA